MKYLYRGTVVESDLELDSTLFRKVVEPRGPAAPEKDKPKATARKTRATKGKA